MGEMVEMENRISQVATHTLWGSDQSGRSCDSFQNVLIKTSRLKMVVFYLLLIDTVAVTARFQLRSNRQLQCSFPKELNAFCWHTSNSLSRLLCEEIDTEATWTGLFTWKAAAGEKRGDVKVLRWYSYDISTGDRLSELKKNSWYSANPLKIGIAATIVLGAVFFSNMKMRKKRNI